MGVHGCNYEFKHITPYNRHLTHMFILYERTKIGCSCPRRGEEGFRKSSLENIDAAMTNIYINVGELAHADESCDEQSLC